MRHLTGVLRKGTDVICLDYAVWVLLFDGPIDLQVGLNSPISNIPIGFSGL